MTVYMQGTRRLEEMIANARQLAYQETYSYTEGWDDNTVSEIFNLGLNELYDALCQVDNVANIEQVSLNVIAQQQAYDIPQNVKLAISIMDVRFLYGPEPWQFVTLAQGMIQDRFAYPTNIPDTYCIRNGQMLLSPVPNITRDNSLVINYQKRMRKLDVRRGKVSSLLTAMGTITDISATDPVEITTAAAHGLSTGNKVGISGDFEPSELNNNVYTITVTGATTFTLDDVDGTNFTAFTGTALWFLAPLQFQLNFTVTSQKDTNLQANANSILDKIDWICMTDRNGGKVIDAIPISSYNMTSFIVTADQNYVIPYEEWLVYSGLLANQDTVYVLSGDYSSSHSQLDRQCEDLLIEYAVLRLLRLQSAAEPTKDQLEAEQAVLTRLRYAYRRYRPSIVPIIWQPRLRNRSWPFGARGIY